MTQAQKQPFPQVNTVFELTASSEITPFFGLIVDFGDTPSKWRSTAATVPAGTSKKFKLVAVGYQPNLDGVARACNAQGGKDTNGCWMKVFNDTFGSNGQNPVGVPDASWLSPDDSAYFPAVEGNDYRHFRWADFNRDGRWLWLVEV